MSMAFFSPPLAPSHLPTLSGTKPHLSLKTPHQLLLSKRNLFLLTRKASENGEASVSSVVAVEEVKVETKVEEVKASLGSNGAPAAIAAAAAAAVKDVVKFGDARWVGGTWDLKQFGEGGKTNWDAVIDAEVRRRKWLEANPESSNNDEPIVFDTSIIPWWSWVKRFHLPEAELLNGRAAMIGFFMAYFVDSLTGVGLVDQMGNFFCKTLLFVSVLGVLFIRKNEDVENLKKLFEETTFYDKQWQATWQDENNGSVKKD